MTNEHVSIRMLYILPWSDHSVKRMKPLLGFKGKRERGEVKETSIAYYRESYMR